MARIAEKAVVKQLVEQLIDKDTRIFLEVPSLGQSVDVAWISGEEITFIEAKVNDWRRALKQCEKHFLVADYIWIAVAMKTVNEALLDQARTLGIGVMHYKDGLVLKCLDAKKNEKIWRPQNEVMKNYLTSNKHEYPALDDICNIC